MKKEGRMKRELLGRLRRRRNGEKELAPCGRGVRGSEGGSQVMGLTMESKKFKDFNLGRKDFFCWRFGRKVKLCVVSVGRLRSEFVSGCVVGVSCGQMWTLP